MAGQLVQVATNTVTSAVSSVTLTGIDSDDVYMCAISNVIGSIDNQAVRFRLGNSGTPNYWWWCRHKYRRSSKLYNLFI